MPSLQERYDDAMFDFSTGDYAGAIARFSHILEEDPRFFDAQLAIAMAYCRLGDYPRAIVEGHKAEKLRPDEQLVHTNLSLFYLKAGDKAAAEHHGLRARVASWKDNLAPPGPAPAGDTALPLAQPSRENIRLPGKFPDQPWKQKDPP